MEIICHEPGQIYLVDDITFSNGYQIRNAIISFTDNFLVVYENRMQTTNWYAIRTVNRIRGVEKKWPKPKQNDD